MPLTPIQLKVVKVLRPFRSDSHYIAGGAALNRRWLRLSDDLDIWADAPGLPRMVQDEIEALRNAGFEVDTDPDQENDLIVEIVVKDGNSETRIEWSHSPITQIRFFEAQPDDELGFRIHDVDNAINKLLAASRRRTAARDVIDVANIDKNLGPLGPLIWAATGMPNEDRTPLQIIRAMRAIAYGYTEQDFYAVAMDGGNTIDRDALLAEIDDALNDAADYCEDLAPIDLRGCLFVEQNDMPIAATEDMLDGVRVLQVRDFQATPQIRS